jgi:hypothetical protein
MLKFFHGARIFNFRILLADLSFNFKQIVLCHLDELRVLQYMVGKLHMSSFQPNFNRNKILLVAPDMSQTVYEGLI